MRAVSIGLGIEAIKVQRKEVLFLGLAGKINELRKGKVNQSTLNKSGIADLISKATNLNAAVKLTEMDWVAFVQVPRIDKNHPLLADVQRHRSGDEDALLQLSKGKKQLDGWVDLEGGKVHGCFTEMPVTITISENMFTSSKMSDEEIAAILMHEVGHPFTYFEMLGQTLSANWAINTAVTAMLDPNRKVPKVKIIDAYAKLRGVSFEDKEAMINMESSEGLSTVMLQAEVHKSVSATGSSMYDMTGFEYLSDQFATRHGGGMALVTALDKLQRFNRDPVYRNIPVFYTLELLKAMGFMAAVAAGPATLLMAMVMVGVNPHERIYDLPRDRAERVERDLNEQLKNKKLSKEERETLIESQEAVKAVQEAMVQRNGIHEMVWKVISPTTRKQLKQKDAQQKIEKLLSNEMFVAAAKFENLRG